MTTQRLLPTFPNFREVSGVPAEDGRVLRPGAIYRSEAILSPLPEDTEVLRQIGIRTVFDLRGPDERARHPNHWWQAEGVDIREMDLVADARNAGAHWEPMLADPDGSGGAAMMLSTYRSIPLAALPHMGAVFSALVDGGAPILVHCAAGKDRTGFVVAAILVAIGIRLDAVHADYLESRARRAQTISDYTRSMLASRLGREPSDAAVRAITGVDQAYLEASFATIEAEFGSVDAYFAEVGWDEARRRQLQDALLI